MKIKELYEQVNDGKIISDIELQREIIYGEEKQILVIDSIVKGIPLPAFYFWKNEEGVLEVLDGKQRIEAIRNFYQNGFHYEGKLWMQIDPIIQAKINETEIKDIICNGSEQLKREIFRRINTLGIALSDYEVLNGLFHGEYLRGLSRYVENDRNAKKVLGETSRGKAKYTLIKLLGKLRNFSSKEGINEYINANQNESFEKDQREIKKYIDFIAEVFDTYGGQLTIYFELSIKYLKDKTIWKNHNKKINVHIKRFLKSDDAKIIKNKAKEIEDIINSVVNNISVDFKRLFTADDKKELVSKTKSIDGKYECVICKDLFTEDELQVDHIRPWSKGGRTLLSNAQLLCPPCNKKKSNSEV